MLVSFLICLYILIEKTAINDNTERNIHIGYTAENLFRSLSECSDLTANAHCVVLPMKSSQKNKNIQRIIRLKEME